MTSSSFKFWLWLIPSHLFQVRECGNMTFLLLWTHALFLDNHLSLNLRPRTEERLPAPGLADQSHSHTTWHMWAKEHPQPWNCQWSSWEGEKFFPTLVTSWWHVNLALPGLIFATAWAGSPENQANTMSWFCSGWLTPFMAFSPPTHEATNVTATGC